MSGFLKKYLYVKDVYSFLLALVFHGVILLFLVIPHANSHSSQSVIVQNFVVADVAPAKENEQPKEITPQKSPLSESKTHPPKKDVVISPGKKDIPQSRTGGGSTTGFKNGDAGEAIASKGNGGDGYGTSPGSGVAYQSQDVYRVAVEEMPEPYGGVEAIRSKAKNQIANAGASSGSSVFVLAFIDESGIVRKVQITKGVGKGIDEIIASAVQRTRFRPGKDKGKIVKVQMHLNIPVTP